MPTDAASTAIALLEACGIPAVLYDGTREVGRSRAAESTGFEAGGVRARVIDEGPSLFALPSGHRVAARLALVPGDTALEVLVLLPCCEDLPDVERLRLLNVEMEVIFNSSYDELYMTDGSGVTLRASAACERHYGLKPHELEGRNVRDLEREGIFAPSATVRVLEERRRVTLMQETSHGRRLLVTANPVFDETGNLIRVISNSRDITEVLLLKKHLDDAERMKERYSQELETLRQEHLRIPGLVSESPAMRRVMDLIARVAEVDSTVLILGESGVGKNAVTKLLHSLSPRRDGPFVEINCGAIPETLLESELFGYERGAFTGARKEGKPGLFELANQGTLFLNEVAELPLGMQVKLLQVLQDRTITRLGGRRPQSVDVRIVAATNRDLAGMVERGQFRADLYYRLNVVPVTILPLRERRDDTLPLLQQSLARFNGRYGKEKTISPGTLHRLMEYEWPGNLRELENLVERLVVTSAGPEITVDDLPLHMQPRAAENGSGPIMPLDQAIAEVEERLYRAAWAETHSSYKVAQLLGVSQSTAYRRLRKFFKSEEIQ